MPNPGGQDVAKQAPKEGSGAESKGKRRTRWLRKGIAAVGEKLSSDRMTSNFVNGRQPATRLQKISPRLKDHEIRLVHLEPRDTSKERIHCNLVTEDLDETTQYEALSYEWGQGLPERSIVMNGNSISVRENLWWALHHLQLEKETRILWIDALCINQENTVERNHQVAQMGKIYSSAARCIAWVGLERIIHQSSLQVDNCELAIEFIKKAQMGEDREDNSRGLSSRCKQEHDSLEFICRRKYWSRLWIIQEILLSSDVIVQCGSHEVPWQALCQIFNTLKTSVHASYQFSISSSAPFRLNQQNNARKPKNASTNDILSPTLADLVLQFKGSQCQDPRDTVFGLLGLARVCCRQAVQANYSASPEQICTTLLIHQIVSHLDLTDKSPDIAADIQELCDTIVFNSKAGDISRFDDTSTASASMKAFRGFELRRKPTPAGRVIWVVPALMLRIASQKSHMAYVRDPEGAATSSQATTLSDQPKHCLNSQPSSDTEKESEDLLDILMNRVNSQDSAYYDHARLWVKQRESPSTKPRTVSGNLRPTPPWLTHLFLTDIGYSGITVSGVKLGHKAYKMSDFDCHVTFHSRATSSGSTEEGICLDPRITFQDLLSWVV